MKRLLLLVVASVALAGFSRAADPTPSPTGAKDEMGTIAGIPIQRASGWLGLELVDNTFKLTFYNEKKKPVAADASSAVMRWAVKYQPNDERTLLTPAGSSVLASSYVVKPPHAFQLHMTLLFADKPDASEPYLVDFSD
jgi:hypothetical protein